MKTKFLLGTNVSMLIEFLSFSGICKQEQRSIYKGKNKC